MQVVGAPLVFVADDDPAILTLMRHHLERWGCAVRTAERRAELLELLSAERPCLVLIDLKLGEHDGAELLRELLQLYPGLTAAIMTGFGSIDSAVAAIKLGAYEYLTKPLDINRLQVLLKHAIEKHKLSQQVKQLERAVEGRSFARPLWGDSPAMEQILELIAAVAPSNATVLVLGESGTGKELVAHAIHERSLRREGPFIPVNMAALPRELVEATLFGHERGAFTGADQQQIGCCEAASGGTLFLDEITELDFDLQAKLLRFLQERTIQRVGSTKLISVDPRIIAATNRDPIEQVRAGRLREDLYYRLNVVPIAIPPLRARRRDIPLLATRFLIRSAMRSSKGIMSFSPDALQILCAYDWPGNVRELENLVERMAILSRSREIGANAIPPEIVQSCLAARRAAPTSEPGTIAAPPKIPDVADATALNASKSSLRPIDQVEKEAIERALAESNGNVAAAARLLGLGQATVYRKVKRYGIAKPTG